MICIHIYIPGGGGNKCTMEKPQEKTTGQTHGKTTGQTQKTKINNHRSDTHTHKTTNIEGYTTKPQVRQK